MESHKPEEMGYCKNKFLTRRVSMKPGTKENGITRRRKWETRQQRKRDGEGCRK